MLTDLASKYQSPSRPRASTKRLCSGSGSKFCRKSSLAVYLPPLQRFFFSIPLQIDPQAPSKLSFVNLGRVIEAPGRRE